MCGGMDPDGFSGVWDVSQPYFEKHGWGVGIFVVQTSFWKLWWCLSACWIELRMVE